MSGSASAAGSVTGADGKKRRKNTTSMTAIACTNCQRAKAKVSNCAFDYTEYCFLCFEASTDYHSRFDSAMVPSRCAAGVLAVIRIESANMTCISKPRSKT